MKRRESMLVGAAALAVIASRLLCRARLPGTYDAVDFLRALDRFDLTQFQPHFPGYPVYVGLGRAAHALGLSPQAAATTVSALAAGATTLAVFRLGKALSGRAGGASAIGLYVFASLPWLLGGDPLPESTAVALGAWSFALLVPLDQARPALGALCAALMLGARPDYAPLALSFVLVAIFVVRIDRTAIARAAAVGALGVAAWLVPLLAIVGPSKYLALGRTHLAGHFERWGGSIATRPELGERASAFLRDLLFDGIVPERLLFIAFLTLVTAALLWRARSITARQAQIALLVAAPYGLWVLFGQNVIGQPRHLIPLTVMLLVGLGALLGRQPVVALAAILTVALASTPLALERTRSIPAPIQAARYVEAHFRPAEVVVFGSQALRLFEWAAPSYQTRTRTWLSEVDVDLERLPILPPQVLVTDELEVDPARARLLGPKVTFCEDPRLDREHPCLSLRQYRLGVAP